MFRLRFLSAGVALATVLLVTLLLASSSSLLVAAIPVIEIKTAEHYNQFTVGEEHDAALVFFYASWDQHSVQAKRTFMEAAEVLTEQHVTGLAMAVVDGGKNPALARSIGVRGFPTILLYQFGTNPSIYSYGFGAHYNVDTIVAFATHETVKQRGVLTKLKEARDEKERTHYDFPHPSPGKVVELTAKNFNRVIRDPTKTGFVMYYAAWCEICKNTMPEVEKLAQYYATDGNIVIGRMEVDENKEWLDANGLEIEGVPIFYMYVRGRRDKEKGWMYLGERDFDSMSVYVNTNAKKPIQDMHEFHADILANRPQGKDLPEHQREGVKDMKALPEEIFGADGRPHGEELGGMKPQHATNDVKEGRARSRKERGHPDEQELAENDPSLTEEERAQQREMRIRKDRKIKEQGGMFSQKLPPEMKGII